MKLKSGFYEITHARVREYAREYAKQVDRVKSILRHIWQSWSEDTELMKSFKAKVLFLATKYPQIPHVSTSANVQI